MEMSWLMSAFGTSRDDWAGEGCGGGCAGGWASPGGSGGVLLEVATAPAGAP